MEHPEIKNELLVLQRMLGQLPPDVSKLLIDQLNIVIDTINNRSAVVREHINEQLDDIRLAIKTMQFDLEATKSEKELLAEKLRDAGLE